MNWATMRLVTISLFIVNLCAHYSSAANCKLIGYEGYATININNPVDDDAEIFLTIDTENVVEAKINNPTSNPYIDIELSDSKLIFKPSATYVESFEEENYMSTPRVSTEVRLTCKDSGIYDIAYIQTLTDKNTYEPTFAKDVYEFTVPMPIVGGIQLTSNFGDDIYVTDYDVSNNRIDFTIEGDYSNLLETSSKVIDFNNKKHQCILSSKTPFRLNNDTTYVLTATDVGNPTRNSTVEIVLKIDESGSLPLSPSFQSGYYRVAYHNENDTHSIDNILIPVSEGVTTANIVLQGAYKYHFQYNVGTDGLEISLRSNLPQNVIYQESFIALSITASIENAEVTAKTSLIVTMPDKINLAFENVFYETVYNEINGIPEITPITIEVTNGATVVLDGDYEEYFMYDNVTKSIKPVRQLPIEIVHSKSYVDIKILATVGDDQAEAILIVSMPGQENLAFGKMLYNAVYSEIGQIAEITPVVIEVTDGATVLLEGEYKEYFMYDEITKSITASRQLPLDVVRSKCYIQVIIQAILEASVAEALLVVSMPENISEIERITY